MLIQEAIESGKPFKHANDPKTEWIIVGKYGDFLREATGHPLVLLAFEITAYDWEIKK